MSAADNLLPSTSAVVLLLLRGRVYRSPAVRRYLSALDLSAGRPLYRKIIDICPFYDQVINNRKYGILHLIRILRRARQLPRQIIILAAGMDPLGLELAALYPQSRIFEIDIAHMRHKAGLIEHPRIAFLTADLEDRQLCLDVLRGAGWSIDQPGLVIAEGISYYIGAGTLAGLLTTTTPRWAVIEYHKQQLTSSAGSFSSAVFSEILGADGCRNMPRYSSAELSALIGLPCRRTLGMHALETLRRVKPRRFPAVDDGWIEVALFGPAA